MVASAGAKAPAPGRLVGFVNQNECFRSAAGPDLKAMIGAVFAGLAKSESFHIEALLFGNFSNRQHRPMESAHAHIRSDFGCRPAFAFISGVLDHLQLQSGRMFEADKSLAKTLLGAAVLDVVPLEMIQPELRGPLRDGISSGPNLARAGTSLHALIRERCVDGARFRIGVGVIQMVMGIAPVKKNRLLDKALTRYGSLKINVFLGAAGADGDVMDSGDKRHISYLAAIISSPGDIIRRVVAVVPRREICREKPS